MADSGRQTDKTNYLTPLAHTQHRVKTYVGDHILCFLVCMKTYNHACLHNYFVPMAINFYTSPVDVNAKYSPLAS